MCGSGTFLIEAAQMALDIAPGLGRGIRLRAPAHPRPRRLAALRRAAEQRRKAGARAADLRSPGRGLAVLTARRMNLDAAGLADCVRLDRAVLERTPPAAAG